MADPVGTFVDEGQAFVGRHPELNEAQRSMGGVAWGMLRTVLECPDHPGVFRVPLDKDWGRLVCPEGETWIRHSQPD